MAQITLDELNEMNKAALVAALGDIFEHSPWIAETAFAGRPFKTVHDLQQALNGAVSGAPKERQLALIKAHPDLAGKAALAGTITADSKLEQTSAGLDQLTEAEFAAFQRFNALYRDKFGMPFVVCVRRHGKDSILRQFELRLQNDTAAELSSALTEILRIGALRLAQRVTGPDRLDVSGRLSTHVLDNHRGRPAAGVDIEFFEVANSGHCRLLSRTLTNADGRTDRPVIADRPIPIARYELRFAVGDYFARAGTATAEPPFLDVVPVRFSVAEPEGHYHVPLLVTPWSYATYRGS
ncbi:MAG TPA: 2-oxo-4-hydroxy-4-carboxy-5-ureidoimidazoline decarboxylase [Xanthobacteraceae bacterium]|nr:2-oxo-4-hydroxy-4-carboxy-5-ureidoimidazoline decarboxylase [Xanthobacteraceae bacterium]